MRYDFNSSSFLGRRFGDEGEEDPMAGLANLADVMLVFACGLMMALVVFWNLDLPSIVELDESKMQEVEDVEEMVDNINSTTNPYMEMGKVYQDPTTGKLYMMQEVDEDDGTSSEVGSTADPAADANSAGSRSDSGA